MLLGLFALFGMFLIRGGITGYAISESCCYGDDCALENQCPATTSATFERPALMSKEDSNALSIIGLLMTLISVLIATGYLRRNIKKDREKDAEKEEIINP
jgi:hypothetical protein